MDTEIYDVWRTYANNTWNNSTLTSGLFVQLPFDNDEEIGITIVLRFREKTLPYPLLVREYVAIFISICPGGRGLSCAIVPNEDNLVLSALDDRRTILQKLFFQHSTQQYLVGWPRGQNRNSSMIGDFV